MFIFFLQVSFNDKLSIFPKNSMIFVSDPGIWIDVGISYKSIEVQTACIAHKKYNIPLEEFSKFKEKYKLMLRVCCKSCLR